MPTAASGSKASIAVIIWSCTRRCRRRDTLGGQRDADVRVGDRRVDRAERRGGDSYYVHGVGWFGGYPVAAVQRRRVHVDPPCSDGVHHRGTVHGVYVAGQPVFGGRLG